MSRNKTHRPPQMTFELNSELINQMEEIKRVTKISKSQFIREAVWEKIALIKQTHPAFQSQVLASTPQIPNQ